MNYLENSSNNTKYITNEQYRGKKQFQRTGI